MSKHYKNFAQFTYFTLLTWVGSKSPIQYDLCILTTILHITFLCLLKCTSAHHAHCTQFHFNFIFLQPQKPASYPTLKYYLAPDLLCVNKFMVIFLNTNVNGNMHHLTEIIKAIFAPVYEEGPPD